MGNKHPTLGCKSQRCRVFALQREDMQRPLRGDVRVWV